jgi:hypothetical protein
MARKAEEVAKGMLLPSVIFEELGLKYFGPVDGHDMATLIKTFEFLKKQDRPVLLHVLTQKGRGFEPAMQKQKKFHGLGPYDPETGETKPLGRRTYSEVFADTMVKLAAFDPKVVVITAAMPNGTGLDRFQPHHPDKFFDVGIAEEHAVLFAAGLAANRSAQSIPRFYSVHSIPSCTMSACNSCRWSSAWIEEASPPTTALRTTVFSTSVICGPSRTWYTWFRKTKTSWPTCCSPLCSGTAPSQCAIRAAWDRARP